jgi:hypothetical protein
MSTSPVPSASVAAPKPLLLTVEPPQERDRLSVALRIFYVIPQLVVLAFVYFAAFFVSIAGWFAALFTGELPEGIRTFLAGTLQWGIRVSAYFDLLTDEYPPFALGDQPTYPVHIAIPEGERLNPLAVLFRIILVIPAYIVASVAGAGAFLFAVASWFVIVFTGNTPPTLFEVIRVFSRFSLRVAGYFWMLTPEYGWGVLGDATATTPPAEGWNLTLSDSGRTFAIVGIVLGAVVDITNYSRYL